MPSDKFLSSINALDHALEFERKIAKDEFYFNGIAKTFEVAFEYGWKFLKQKVEESGLDAPSPRDAIKMAGTIDQLEDVELWLECLRVRNVAVHDYLGVSKQDYLELIKKFLASARKSLKIV